MFIDLLETKNISIKIFSVYKYELQTSYFKNKLKKYQIKVKLLPDNEGIFTGNKQNLILFLKDEYLMDKDEITDLYPELYK